MIRNVGNKLFTGWQDGWWALSGNKEAGSGSVWGVAENVFEERS